MVADKVEGPFDCASLVWMVHSHGTSEECLPGELLYQVPGHFACSPIQEGHHQAQVKTELFSLNHTLPSDSYTSCLLP